MYLILIIILLIIVLSRCNFFKTNKFNNKKCNDYIIAMFLTSDYCKEAENLIKTLEYSDLKHRLIVYALDEKSNNCINRLNVDTVFKNLNLGNSSYGKELFYKIVTEKIIMIYELLVNQPEDILYMDTDIYVFRNFDEELRRVCMSDYDIVFQCDEYKLNYETMCKNLCTGFFYVKNNDKTRRFFKDSVKRMKQDSYIKDKPADQRIINGSLKNYPELNITTFDQIKFPNGSIFFTYDIKQDPYIVHNNYIKGLDNKVKRFKEHDLWLV